uniref:Transmembrane protein 252 n=1 Tax=Latimeria chalumnae TaxID=7897 RepID=M3XHY9_LATCH|nr:PREDICTED: transmembrane protein 252 [Latimeria chalumnae]|eukprot:XP_014345942.1 PREDICTED: transmembrane protein 252 [Latimeria chalumnae]
MEVRKKIIPLLLYLLPVIGFLFICLGAFLLSVRSFCQCETEWILAYSVITVGFILLLIGIFWSMYFGAKKKVLFHHLARRSMPQPGLVHVNTVDRPDFYPPSYEEAVHSGTHSDSVLDYIITENEGGYNLPPPLYTESSSEVPEEDCGIEVEPPSYETSVHQSSANGDLHISGV